MTYSKSFFCTVTADNVQYNNIVRNGHVQLKQVINKMSSFGEEIPLCVTCGHYHVLGKYVM
jgi:translation initiation factor 2 beta subunit (eIF-2beta)/eIF-5